MPLTSLAIKNAKPKDAPYKLRDGKGLYLEVRPSGGKFWRYRFRHDGKESMLSLGEFGDRVSQVGLDDARRKRDEARQLIKEGKHPGQHRAAAKAAAVSEGKNTFEAVAQEWVEENRSHWSGTYLKQVQRGLREDISPVIGSVPIRSVSSSQCLQIVKDTKKRGAATVALLLQQWMGAVFRYAIAHQLASMDPTYAIRGAVKREPVQHHKPLALKEIPALLTQLQTYGGYRATVIAMRLLMLTFVRPGELRGAKWAEFDLDEALWRIPKERMKMGEAHIVPLSSQAVTLLRELHTLTGGRDWLFPNLRSPDTCMTMTTLNRALERMGYGGRFTSHGFRATASTALNEMGFREDVIERQLAHAERNKSRASYNRAQYLDERRSMMQQWADVIDSNAGAKVIPLKAAVQGK